jgi:fructose-1,6-bisphosphatase I
MSEVKKLSVHLERNTPVELAHLLVSLAEGCKIIARLVNNAGLSGILGAAGHENVQGEDVQKLDDLSNKILMDYLKASGTCAGYLSEENDNIVTLNNNGKYTIAIDPLDGSSNIDACAPIGTIFSVNERLSTAGNEVNNNDFLQKGIHTRAAGYVIYGSSTILVLATEKGVNGFTLNTTDSEFYLSHPEMKIPSKGKIYSLNQGNAAKYDEGLKNFISYCTAVDKETSRPYSLRYIGSMVGDVHRNLIKGGIFIYPANKGEEKGKLRLLYECIPMSYLTEQAGGSATDGNIRILELQPTEVHERTAIYVGSKEMVEKVHGFLHP